jgi:hypothetical protein
MSLHEEWDVIDLHMSGELAEVYSDVREMLDGTRLMTPEEERVLGDLAQAWRKLGVQR